MTTNFHTPIALGATLNDLTLNNPLSALDTALTLTRAGRLTVGTTTVTISSDVFTISGNNAHFTLSSQTGFSDNLIAINGAPGVGQVIWLTTAAGHSITINHLAVGGNIEIFGASNILLTTQKTIALIWNGLRWNDFGGGGGSNNFIYFRVFG
jgi:hypothetical protein